MRTLNHLEAPNFCICPSYTAEHLPKSGTYIRIQNDDPQFSYFTLNTLDPDSECLDLILVPVCKLAEAFNSLHQELIQTFNEIERLDHMGDDEHYDYFPDGYQLLHLLGGYLIATQPGITTKAQVEKITNAFKELDARIKSWDAKHCPTEDDDPLMQQCCPPELDTYFELTYQLNR